MTDLRSWLDHQRLQSGLDVQKIPLSSCTGWCMREGKLVHESGGFFSLRGCHFFGSVPHLNNLSMPMIDQPEVGLLGFVVRRGLTGWEWLLQAKTEPGSVGGTQVGPSVQATRSNWLRRHGGKATPLLELFYPSGAKAQLITDVEQSEQGDRFLGKYNRNAVVQVDGNLAAPEGGQWRWFAAREVLDALGKDTLINTDSRSVLWCSDWRLLMPPGESHPFQRWRNQGGFGEALLNSALIPSNPENENDESGYCTAIAALDAERCQTQIQVAFAPLDQLKDWTLDAFGLQPELPEPGAYLVRAIAVQAKDREVSSWYQPILESTEEQIVILLCANKDGILHFALSLSAEPGFREGIQFAPSLVSGPGHAHPAEWWQAASEPEAVIRATTRQSDEGGRFLHSIARYQILEVPAAWVDHPVDHGLWVTLSALRLMGSRKGFLNNELRSALSMLLSWL